MTARQAFRGMLLAVAVLVVLVFVSIKVLGGLLQTEANKLADLKSDAATIQAKQAQLSKNKQDLAKYADLNTIAKTVVPQDKDQAQAVREIVALAKQSGINRLSSVTFAPSNLGTPATTGASPVTQATLVKGMAGVYTLPITVSQANTSPVSYSSFLSFLTALERNRRTAQVSSVDIQPDQKDPGKVSFTLIVNEYIKP